MIYLIDTNVVSELRKSGTPKIDRHVYRWARNISAADMFLSSISVLELELGVLLLERRDSAQGRILRTWMEDRVLPSFTGRILPVDARVARRAAALHVPNPCSHRDAVIAATALVHGMTVVTRNTADFVHAGVSLLNPWRT